MAPALKGKLKSALGTSDIGNKGKSVRRKQLGKVIKREQSPQWGAGKAFLAQGCAGNYIAAGYTGDKRKQPDWGNHER